MNKFMFILGISFVVAGITGIASAGMGHGHKGPNGMSKKQSFSEDVVEVGNKICPVSKQAVDAMGSPVQYEYKGRVYNLCCRMCLRDFKKDPEKFSRIADQEVAAREGHGDEDGQTGRHDH